MHTSHEKLKKEAEYYRGRPEQFPFKEYRRPIKKELRLEVFYRDKKLCRYCGIRLRYKTFHVDHIIPVIRGGTNEINNLTASCPPCNLKKGSGIL